jgi:solute carrier family 35 protein E1
MSASNYFGLLCAFASAIIFVSSNIFFKKVMPTPSHGGSAVTHHRLDKINLLFYASTIAFLMMVPLWAYTDMVPLLNRWSSGSIVATNLHVRQGNHSLSFYFIANGSVHFLQNVIAFAILATTSPVTYSIASLVKRIAVICIAIVWFSQSIHPVQGFGICLTFAGLWMYNRAKGDVERGEKMVRRVEAMKEIILPTTKEELELLEPVVTEEESYAIRQSIASAQQHATGIEFHSPPQRSVLPAQPYPHPHPHAHSRAQSQSQPRAQSQQPTRPRHTKNAPSIPAPLNTVLAASTYVAKAVPIFSPPSQDPAEIAVDPYPSPPKSLDSPPPELDDLINAIGTNNNAKPNEAIRNRRGTLNGRPTVGVAAY